MGDILLFLPIVIVVIIGFVAAPLMKMFANTFGDSEATKTTQKDAKYNRQVHQMHAKDAVSERKHYLDQLKSLYEAGMMERDEYNEKVAAIEAEYNGKYW